STQPSKPQSQPGTSKTKATAKPPVGPKSPVFAKHDTTGTRTLSPAGKSSSSASKVCKTIKSDATANPVSHSETAISKAVTNVKKSDPVKSKKPSPSSEAVKKPTTGDKKKIQKELKNLGITDGTIHQIDTATVECNPSISEMVKTKSRATVSQQKYNETGSLGGASGSTAKAGCAAKPETTLTSDGGTNKPTEASTITITPSATNKKRPGAHPASGHKLKDAAIQKPTDTSKRELATEGGKTRIPATTILPTSVPQPTTITNVAAVKEVVKTAPTKLCDSKSKTKKPENNDDNNDATADQHKPTKRNTGATPVATLPKAKARTKKVMLEERRAAEARSKATTEIPSAVAGSTASLFAASAAVNVCTKHTDDKQKIEEEKTCSLGDLEPDDRHEADVQSRIEDIVKALEQEDDDENDGAGVTIHPKTEQIKTEPPIGLEEQSPATKEKTVKKATTKPKGSKSQRKAPTKKKTPVVVEKLEAKDETQKNSITVENNPPAVKATEELLVPKPTVDVIPVKRPESTGKGTATPQTKRKYIRKPKTGEPTVKNVDQKKVNFSEILPTRLESHHTKEKDAQKSTETVPTGILSKSSSHETEFPDKICDKATAKQPESPEPPKTLRSSTENDDDLPLNQLKDKTKSKSDSPQVFTTPALVPSAASAEPTNSSGVNPPAATPLLASLLAKPTKSKRKYVRKTPVKQSPKVTTPGVATKEVKEDKKSEKKDVYDFDDSESDIETPVKGGKPTFKRKPLESTSTIKDEEDDENSEEVQVSTRLQNVKPVSDEVELPVKPEKKNENGASEESSNTNDVKKAVKKSSTVTERVRTPKEPTKVESSNSEQSEDDLEKDPDERPRTPISRKVKLEVRDSSDDESDGYSSEESVRTRIVKKQLTAKTRHLKLYGFWSGPKRHRVASLNAIAKVHCLYENETRAALEASLMKQGTSRAAAAATSTAKAAAASKVVKKEKPDDDEDRKHDAAPVKEDKSEKKEKVEDKNPKESKTVNVKDEKKKPTKSVTIKEDKKKETKKTDAKEDRKDSKKKEKQKEETETDSDSEESEEEVVTRTLRCVPGLRGAGKHWDPNASSMESEDDLLPDSDETYAQGKDTDPVKKRKIKRKIVKKPKPKPKCEKPEKAEKPDRPKPPAKKIKREVKALMSDSDKQAEESCSSSSGSEKQTVSKSKSADAKKRKRKPKEKKEVVEVLAKKRMASLNATAMLAATYEVQRILYRNTDSDSDNPAHKPKSKKAKEQKEAKEKDASKAEDKKETKESKIEEKPAEAEKVVESTDFDKSKEVNKEQEKEEEKEIPKEREKTITVKTELLREKRDELEVKREIEEPRPMSSNVVIAQDTEVTITGVYVNSSLGANQEAYCKMQYRVQQSVTEERLVRPGEGPPRSYTPLSALSSMRPPNDQNLSTPPLFGQPSTCDSPLGLGPPRSFYPPPTSSSGSSSAFCAPVPHDSPGYYQPAGPLISPHLLPQPPQGPPSSTSQHSSSSSTVTKQPPESDSPVQSLQQPPSSSTADSTDSDVLLTGGDLSGRSQPYRYGPTGPPNIYPRPVQMHCPPPPHLAPNYYAAPPYSQYPPEMYYTHAYPPAHFYPKFAQYYPSRRYYPGPPGPGEHMYEQPPPPTSAPVPPPAGAQLVPAGPQGPQHMEHYPGPPPYPYPGYGSPGPGPGGQCYSRNLQPPPYMDAHYTTNCPCPMQSCPKNVNAGSLIGIKASKGPVATVSTQNHHIASAAVYSAPAQTATVSSSNYKTVCEPIMISSGSSTSSSPLPPDIHAPIVCPAEVETSMCHVSPSPAVVTPVTASVACSSAAITNTTNTTSSSSITTIAEPNRTPKVKPESDLYLYSKNYHLHHHHYHQQHRPSAPPPTHPLQNYTPTTGPLLTEVKEEPSTPTPDADSKSVKNIPKLIPITTALVKQEITEVKQELPAVVSCKKEHFEENGPAMTPDLLLDEALIKKEELVTELLLPNRCFVQNQKLDEKCLLSDILTAEGNLVTSKTTGSDSCSNNNNNNNNSSISNEKVQLVDSVLPDIPASMVKRRPLLVACKKATPKKSPPNSYKNLIKRTNLDEESTITVLSDDDEEDDEEEEVTQKKPRRKLLPMKPRKILKRTRRVFGAEQLKHLKKLSSTMLQPNRMRRIFKRPSCIPRNPTTSQQATTKTSETSTPTKDNYENTPKTTTPDNSRQEPEVPPVKADSTKLSETAQEMAERPRPVSNVDLTIDLVAKGYFSEPEILCHEVTPNSRLIKKLKLQKGRSQSEQNRGKREGTIDEKHSSKKAKKVDNLDVDFDKRKAKCRSKKSEQVESDNKQAPPAKNDSPNPAAGDTNKALKVKHPHQPKPSEPKEKKPKKEHKQCSKKKSKAQKQIEMERATSTPLPHAVELEPANLNVSEINAIEPIPSVDDREMDFDDAATVLVDDDMMSVDTNTMINRHNNNNSSGVENKNPIAEEEPLEQPAQATVPELSASGDDGNLGPVDDDDEDEEIMLAKRFAKKGTSVLKRNARSRSKSKSRKFSTKKRHRVYRLTTEIEELIVPRKCNSVPRWSNGWTWEGQPFQGKVFLNSDDLPVLRTCYPAMRHSEGDIIRPRDCVLLRAGSKRAELPYVAKVAYLWENPEDGEMMMSLLWYYRPEHTEQGRQPTDGPDEVFASRHKDHNSVACIEDKCYVLTFSEYCRFRRQLKGFEENIEEHPSIVPLLRRENPRLPPPVVAPELVMYCQRVYEFRLKRLLKTPS
ncbi:uncharacterized protein LOC128739552, partial [Sabethes cyaneus]|uniref:uncharacterized protein LOC128739552 n=1 Tax=Sabethes cyaneus TaxID=53552 RepID=UPI00237DED43